MGRNKQSYNPDLRTVTVEPGSVTGLYYIPIANLDHGTTWQDLKEFASQVCKVDYADIYNPTSGLIRVRGRENFERCFQHLNGNVLHLRSLQADDRNRDQPTVVRLPYTDFHAVRILSGQTVQSYDESHKLNDNYSQQPAYPCDISSTSPSSYQPFSSCTSPAPSHSTAGWGHTPATSITGPSSSTCYASSVDEYALSYHQHQHQQSMSMSMSMSMGMSSPPQPQHLTPIHSSPPSASYAAAPYPPPSVPDYDLPTTATTASSSSSYPEYSDYAYQQYPPLQTQDSCVPPVPFPPPQDSVILDLRKIIILNLERRRLSIPYVADIIFRYTGGIGEQQGEIEMIEVPVNQNGRARGTTYVTFRDHELAAATVRALNDREVSGNGDGGGGTGKRLVCRFMEGVSRRSQAVGVSGRVGGAGAGAAGDEGKRKKEKKDKDRNSVNKGQGQQMQGEGGGGGGGGGMGGGGMGAEEGAPVIVDGTVGRRGGRGRR